MLGQDSRETKWNQPERQQAASRKAQLLAIGEAGKGGIVTCCKLIRDKLEKGMECRQGGHLCMHRTDLEITTVISLDL